MVGWKIISFMAVTALMLEQASHFMALKAPTIVSARLIRRVPIELIWRDDIDINLLVKFLRDDVFCMVDHHVIR